jgi:hypothetical protein
MQLASINRVERAEAAILRALMVAMAAATWFVGFSLLTSPLAVPITLGIWACAAGMAWLGLFGSLPTDGN